MKPLRQAAAQVNAESEAVPLGRAVYDAVPSGDAVRKKAPK
jgi:hypothetical protein